MSGIDRTINCAATFGFERAVRGAARFFRPTFDFDPLERQLKRDHFAVVVRIWLVTIFLLTLPAVFITIIETIQTKYFFSTGSGQIHQTERSRPRPAGSANTRSQIKPVSTPIR